MVLVWDWDGTLVDSFETIRQAYNAARTTFGLSEWSIEDAYEHVALSGRDSFPKMFGDNAKAAEKIFYSTYESLAPNTICAKPQRQELLEAILVAGGVNLVVSNKRGDILRAECTSLGWDKYFKALVGAGDAATDKPSAAPVYLAYQQSEIALENNHFMIGDAPIDGETARAAGISSVLLYGETHSQEGLQGHGDYIMAYDQLSDFIARGCKEII